MFKWVLGACLDVAAGAVVSASVVRSAFGCIWLLDLASGWVCWGCFQGGSVGCFTHPLSYLCLRRLGAVQRCLVPLVLGPGSAGGGVVRFVACMLGGVSRVPWPFRGCGGLGLMGCEVESSARARFAFRGLSCWEASVTLYLWFRF